MTNTLDLPVIIVGGGIAGLTLSIALAHKNIPCHILEKSEHFSEIGAGIQLGPNATKILYKLGLKSDLAKHIYEPETLDIKNGSNNKSLNTVFLKNTVQQLYNSPYFTIHRADLHKVLLEKAMSYECVKIQNNFKIVGFKTSTSNMVALSETGSEIKARLIVGADGIWSSIAKQIAPESSPIFLGKTAWRSLLPMDQCPDFINQEAVTLYMGPNSHLVHYPVKRKGFLNIVAIINDKTSSKSWEQEAASNKLFQRFEKWQPTLQQFLTNISGWTKWPLYQRPVLSKWYQENIVLIGDAAHPILPFLAQGAAMAIEDAKCLADHLSGSLQQTSVTFENFQKERIKRVQKVQQASQKNGTIYHLTGLTAFARNQVIANRSGASLLKDYHWLYGY